MIDNLRSEAVDGVAFNGIKVPVYEPFLHGREKEYVTRCLDSMWISKGEFISAFEDKFAEYLGYGHATTVCNGTAALHLALLALGIGPGDEVIVPTLTYIASVNMIALAGAKPVLVDSAPSTWQIDPEDVRRKITKRTKAVMAVHLYGLPCEMEQLTRICHEHGLRLIEDCAEAFGSSYGGRSVGTFGDIATFSFFGNKTITTGEGGMVVSQDKTLLERAGHLKGQGVSPVQEYWHDVLGFNYRMSNICAAIGLAQLEMAGAILEKKQCVAKWYRDKLRSQPLELQAEAEGTRHSFWMCSALAADESTRDSLRAHLRRRGVETRPAFHPAHTMPVFHTAERFPVAEGIGQRGFSLPSYPALSEEQVDHVCVSIREFYELNRMSSTASAFGAVPT
ncbi:MAG: DegT/DnrJ/EryC1/StrS family aminotransferase [Bryobacteraceae bacterium]|jgi:perosamine synthetase